MITKKKENIMEKIDDTLLELFLILLAISTFGLAYVFIPNPEKERDLEGSYIHWLFKYFNFYYDPID